jgi:hypothetical protein
MHDLCIIILDQRELFTSFKFSAGRKGYPIIDEHPSNTYTMSILGLN